MKIIFMFLKEKNHPIIFVMMLFVACSFKDHRNADDMSASEPSPYALHLKEIATELEAPIGLTNANDGTGRLFVIEQAGQIRIIKNGLLLATPFLDVSNHMDKLNCIYSEKGLLGLAFHPQYKTNGKFYVYYSALPTTQGMDNKSVIAEYTVSSNPDVANTSGRIILEIDEPESNHNGGQLAFGKDGYLYVGVGDGGGAGDKHGTIGNGQNVNTLLGKILRIDVNAASGYNIPADNPFVGKSGRGEIYAVGLRNPWRFSFDRSSGQLFCGDVGQNEFEEVDIVEKGKNYGWRIMEGNHCFNPPTNCDRTLLVMPIDEYDHSFGKSVIGGFVYRGTKYPGMQGKYVFGDWTGKFFMLTYQNAANQWEHRAMTVTNQTGDLYINSFGEDESGELYVVGQNSIGPKKAGKVWQLEFE